MEHRYEKGVYVIQSGDSLKFKIGFTKDIDVRLRNLQTGSADLLKVVFFMYCKNSTRLESLLQKFYDSRLHRGEYYQLTETEVLRLVRFLVLWATKEELKPEILKLDMEKKPLKTRSELNKEISILKSEKVMMEAAMREFEFDLNLK